MNSTTRARTDRVDNPPPLPWEGAIGLAALGVAYALLSRYATYAAHSNDGANALAMARFRECITTAASWAAEPAVAGLLVVLAVAATLASHIMSARDRGLRPASAKQYRAAISSAALTAAGAFGAGVGYTAVASDMAAPSATAATGLLVCLGIAATAVPATDRHR